MSLCCRCFEEEAKLEVWIRAVESLVGTVLLQFTIMKVEDLQLKVCDNFSNKGSLVSDKSGQMQLLISCPPNINFISWNVAGRFYQLCVMMI